MHEGVVVAIAGAIAGAAAEGANPVSPQHRPCGRPPGYSVDKGPFGLRNFLWGPQPTGILFARLRHRRTTAVHVLDP